MEVALGLSRKKRALFALTSMVLGAAFALGAAEIFFRWYESWRQAQRPLPETLHLFESNPHGTGSYRLRAGLDLVTRVQAFAVSIRTNSHGMRWREVSLEKPPRIRRVAFLGDSFTFGCWADSIEKSFVGVFDRSVSPTRFEVLNFGVGGYGLGDMELLLSEEVLRFSPDYVILTMFNGNDFRDTYLGVHKVSVEDGTARFDDENLKRRVPPEFVRNDLVDSKPARDPSAVKRALTRSATYRFLAPWIGTQNLALHFRVSRRFVNLTFWSQYPYPEVARKAKDESLDTLSRMQALLAARGVRLALATLPTPDQVYSNREVGPDFDIDFPQVYVKVFARERGIPFLDLLPPMREHVRETNKELYLSGDMHLNNRGHALVGELLADWFRSSESAPGTVPED